jgi:Helix-turn-helix domain
MSRPTTKPKLLDDYIPEKQLADDTNHDVRTIRGWRAKGQGPAWTRIGRQVLYRKDSIAAWLRSREQGGAA